MKTLQVTAITLVTALTLLFSPSLTHAQASWYNTDWQFRKEITIYASQVPATLDNFPVLVEATASAAQIDGKDILFTKADGFTKIPHEIESYDDGLGALVAWVKIESLDDTDDTVIFMYYGNTDIGIDPGDPTEVWDINNYVMVQHLNEDSGTHFDSTSNPNDGTPEGGVTQDATGKLNGADEFDGTDDYVDCGSDSSLDITGSMTVEAWVSSTGGTGQNRILAKDKPTVKGLFIFWRDGDGKLVFQVSDDANPTNWYIAEGSSIPHTGWFHVVGVYDDSVTPTKVRVYRNGILVDEKNGPTSLQLDTPEEVTIGASGKNLGVNSQFWNGTIDEVRISDTARSLEWIQTSYNNQDDPSLFYNISGEQQQCTVDAECAACEKCDAGTCVVQTEFEDIKNECDDLDCTTGLCDGAGACGVEPEDTSCGDPTATDCNNPDTCDAAGTCQVNLLASGASCGDPTATDCNNPDTCDAAGTCQDNFLASGTSCGDPTATDCNNPDTCDAAGTCQDNFLASGASCGDPTATDCNNPDTCDAAGTCQDNLLASGASCGDPTATDCNNPDTCDAAGTCQDNLLASGASCGDPTATDCNNPDTCDAAGTCQDNLLASGASCGDPTATDCNNPDTCDAAGTCQDNLLASGASCGDPTATDCNNPDTCDAAGTCQDNLLASGASCGDPTATDCNNPDTCDAAGTCQDNLLASGASCGDPTATDCNNPDTCDETGACQDNLLASGTSCGDTSNTECTDPDSCDGTGACLGNHASLGTSCGDPTATDCNNPDTCDAAGTCQDNLLASGTSCGDPTATDCNDPDTCDGTGACQDNLLASGASCGDTTDTDCNNPDTCDEAGTCLDNLLASGTPCGDPADTECTDPDTCDEAGTCLENNASPGDPCDDGLYCTETSQCLSGLCEGSGDPCTLPEEVCDEDSLQCVAAAAGSWWNCAWPYRKELTIDHTKVDEDLTNFPVLIDLEDIEVADNAQMGGIDIVFTDINGDTLPHEIEFYNDVDGHVIAWVNVPSLSSTVDTTLFMYFGNGDVTISQEDVEGTWDNNYVMVQHLNETSGDHIDSTSFLNDGTPFVTTQGIALGQIDGADEFDGTDDLVVVPDSDTLDITGSMTVEAWAYSDGGATGAIRILAKDMEGTPGKFILWRNPQGDLAFIVADDSGGTNPWYRAIGSPVTDGVWFQVVGVFDAAAEKVRLYTNGNEEIIEVDGPGSIQSNTERVTIGASDNNSQNWVGTIDEVRISKVARSAGWIKTSHTNQDDPASFAPIGDAVNQCEGNFDCDLDVDGSDARLFKLDFGRSEARGDPCTNVDPCNGDFDCDGDVDGSDALTFKRDFGRSTYANPCPPCVEGECCSYQ